MDFEVRRFLQEDRKQRRVLTGCRRRGAARALPRVRGALVDAGRDGEKEGTKTSCLPTFPNRRGLRAAPLLNEATGKETDHDCSGFPPSHLPRLSSSCWIPDFSGFE